MSEVKIKDCWIVSRGDDSLQFKGTGEDYSTIQIERMEGYLVIPREYLDEEYVKQRIADHERAVQFGMPPEAS